MEKIASNAFFLLDPLMKGKFNFTFKHLDIIDPCMINHCLFRNPFQLQSEFYIGLSG